MGEYVIALFTMTGLAAQPRPNASSDPCVLTIDEMSEADSSRADAATFESLLTPVLGPAYGMALRLSSNRADAEDVVQEAALLAFRGFHTFEQGTNFKAWFFRILTNAYFGKRRKDKRRPSTVDLDEVPDLYMYKQSADTGLLTKSEDPGSLVVSAMDVEQVTQAIDALPEEYRIVSVLYFLEDMSYQAIADIVEIPVGTVRSRLHRGRKMLQKALWEIAEEAGIIGQLTEGSESR